MERIRTQVGIVGAGPAGLMLSHLLHLQGIESVVVEARSRQHCEERIRAGVLEQGTVDMLRGSGVGERLERQGLRHEGIELGLNRQRFRIPLTELTDGKAVTVYGQHEVVKDLIARRIADGAQLHFDCDAVRIAGFEDAGRSVQPTLHFQHGGREHGIACDYLAGCDGFHGVCRPSIPQAALTSYDRAYPFGWLGVLAEAAPSLQELVYMQHPNGFALYSMRSPAVTRLYLQCAPDEDLSAWSDDRIWSELAVRLRCDDGWAPTEGRIMQKSVTGMRSHVTEPMQFGRLFLAGDAAHIVPPTGAKGMNLAMADVSVLARALAEHYTAGREEGLQSYSQVCLRHVWRAQRFSWWMTSLLHRFPEDGAFDRKRQVAELDYVTHSRAAATALAENYVGLAVC
jgi:p-hydroxybenzoate 3-monooxygenase